MQAQRPLNPSASHVAAGHGLLNEVKPWLIADSTAASARTGATSWYNGGFGSSHLMRFSSS